MIHLLTVKAIYNAMGWVSAMAYATASAVTSVAMSVSSGYSTNAYIDTTYPLVNYIDNYAVTPMNKVVAVTASILIGSTVGIVTGFCGRYIIDATSRTASNVVVKYKEYVNSASSSGGSVVENGRPKRACKKPISYRMVVNGRG